MANAQPVNPMEDMLPDQLLAAAETLASSILEAEPVAAYHQAKERLEADEAAQALLEQLITVQVQMRGEQANGSVNPAVVDRLRALDHQARNNQLIVDYVITQQTATAYLGEVNQEISQLLGIDFNALASSGCC